MLLSAGLVAGCSDRPVVPTGDGGAGSTGGPSATTSGVTPNADGDTGATTGAGNGTETGIATTVASTDDGPEDEGSDGCPFICDPDGGPMGEQCSVAGQDCPAGQKCVWYARQAGGLRRNAARCIDVTGDRQPFETCNLPTGIGSEITDDCNAESYCLEVYGTADHGFCAPFIDEGYDCEDYPGTYGAVENGSDFPAACLHYECQPLLEGTCPDGMQCTFYPAWLYGSMKCWYVPPDYERELGEACDFGQCGEGKMCTPAEWLPECDSEYCCAQWCDLDTPECETPGTTCEPFPVNNHNGDPGFESLGACLLPKALE